MNVIGPSLMDVKAAFGAIPPVGLNAKFAGVLRDNGNSHIQGPAAQQQREADESGNAPRSG
jgi:hypothetical protein